MANRCTRIPEIMFPREGVDLSKWAVIACDQYTSQPDYWAETDKTVGDAPSTLRLTLPEVYLEDADVAARTEKIHQTMQQYVQDGTLRTLPAGVVLTERWSGGSCPRRGIVLSVDLEAYEYTPGSASLIRPTEKTVVERIPPRLKVRQGACLELPHIMILIDDPDRQIIEPLFEQTASYDKLYDTDLMQNGGHIKGFKLSASQIDAVADALMGLTTDEAMKGKYGVSGVAPLLFAVGDGNHSLATAKACYEEQKKGKTPEEYLALPARYALVEVVNNHDDALQFEPIHRVLFGVDHEKFMEEFKKFYPNTHEGKGEGHTIEVCWAGHDEFITVPDPKVQLAVGTLQAFIDEYLKKFGGEVDYIHGDEVTRELGSKEGNMGFLLPAMGKEQLFKTVMADGVLPRKTFSMGHAQDKRYYVEARKIR